MAVAAGMTSAITNPLQPELMQAVRGADVIMGNDPQCARWIRAYRAPGEAAEPLGGRRGGRRRAR
ncbi:methyltetrahydrofolate:corrinoid/iron-sulfur protein methyltransferase [compost metagenome]